MIYSLLSALEQAAVRRYFNTGLYDALLVARPALGDRRAATLEVMSRIGGGRVIFLDESWSAEPLKRSQWRSQLDAMLRASRRQNWIPSDGDEAER